MADRPNEAQIIDRTFEAMALRADSNYDPGLINFKAAMDRVGNILRRGGKSETIGLIEELNAKWPYKVQSVVVTGKVYLNDDDSADIAAFAPESWGQPKVDRWGTFFDVTDVELVSQGVGEITESESKSAQTTVAFLYGSDIEDDEPLFIVRPEDIVNVQYPYPTYEACLAHLKHEYPDLLVEINRIIRPSTQNFNLLNATLHKFAIDHPEVCENATLGMWVAVYINSRIKFDQVSPYGFVVKGELSLPDDEGEDEIFVIDEPFAFDAKIARVAFAQAYRNVDGEETTENMVGYMLTLPSGLSDVGEYADSQAFVRTDAVQSIEPRRPVLSLREQLRQARVEVVKTAIIRLSMLRLEEISLEDAELIQEEDEEQQAQEIILSQIERWEACELTFLTIVDRLVQLRNETFRSHEDALQAATQLADEMTARIAEDERFYQTVLSVQGQGVGIPIVKVTKELDEEQKEAKVTYTVDSSTRSPSRAIDVIGTFHSLVPTIEQLDEESFKPLILMMMGYQQEAPDINLLTFGNTPLVASALAQRGMVRLDGSADIHIHGLERERSKLAAIERLFELPVTATERRAVGSLYGAIKRELPDRMMKLGNMSLIRKFDQIMRTTKHPDELASALNALVGMGRQLIVSGEAIDRDGDILEAEGTLMNCLEVVYSVPHREGLTPALAVRPGQNTGIANLDGDMPILYMPLARITEMRY